MLELPVRRRSMSSTGWACGADDERRRLNKIINPLSETSPYLRTTLLPGSSRPWPAIAAAATDDLALFESGSVFFANDPPVPAPRPPVTQRPSADELAALDRALGRQPRHLAAVLTGQWRAAGWTGPVRRPAGRRRSPSSTSRPRRSGLGWAGGPPNRRPWHPGRCAEFVARGRHGDRVRRRAAPRASARRTGCPLGRRRPRSISTR